MSSISLVPFRAPRFGLIAQEHKNALDNLHQHRQYEKDLAVSQNHLDIEEAVWMMSIDKGISKLKYQQDGNPLAICYMALQKRIHELSVKGERNDIDLMTESLYEKLQGIILKNGFDNHKNFRTVGDIKKIIDGLENSPATYDLQITQPLVSRYKRHSTMSEMDEHELKVKENQDLKEAKQRKLSHTERWPYCLHGM